MIHFWSPGRLRKHVYFFFSEERSGRTTKEWKRNAEKENASGKQLEKGTRKHKSARRRTREQRNEKTNREERTEERNRNEKDEGRREGDWKILLEEETLRRTASDTKRKGIRRK